MKSIIGKVISTKMQKTAVVLVERAIQHPLYKKRFRKNKRFKTDTGNFTLNVGDMVKISQTKPTSKDKHYKIVSVERENIK